MSNSPFVAVCKRNYPVIVSQGNGSYVRFKRADHLIIAIVHHVVRQRTCARRIFSIGFFLNDKVAVIQVRRFIALDFYGSGKGFKAEIVVDDLLGQRGQGGAGAALFHGDGDGDPLRPRFDTR